MWQKTGLTYPIKPQIFNFACFKKSLLNQHMAEQNSKPCKKFKRYTVTSALPYANGPIHIGHLAGVYVPADIYVRYLRLKGEDVISICGSDEHGVPITIQARNEGVTPQEIVDKYHNMNKRSFEDFGISFDIYSRTSMELHHKTASGIFRKLYDEGKLLKQDTQQYYDEENRQFLADRYITGTCPVCNYEKAYGDQCESCGSSLSPTELKNPRSMLSGNKPVMKKTRHWYIPLDQYEPMLKQWILEKNKNKWKSNVYGQCKSWIESGLKPRAVTRDLKWGVKVPIENTEGKVLYVWFDAPIGYISATRQWAEMNDTDWKPYWKDKDTKLVHFIGKDNIVFHCIIFPVILYAEGTYVLPDNVPANEFLNLEGDKISTSRNWAVWLHEYLKEFPGKQDVMKYVLCAAAPETKDNDFTWKDFQARNNNELLAIYGNFVNRTMVLTQKYYNGIVPSGSKPSEKETEIIKQMTGFADRIGSSLENYRFREALSEMMNLARLGNKYLTDAEPWKIHKTDPQKVENILNRCLQICAVLSVLSEPFLPFTAGKLKKMLNISQMNWDTAKKEVILPQGHKLNKPQLLFEKIEDKQVEAQLKKLCDAKQANLENEKPNIESIKPDATFDDFSKLDLRTATILKAEKVSKTKKLLKLQVDTGLDVRTIVAGIAEYYKPEELEGKKIVVIVNLKPRNIRGITSGGMLLMANDNKEGLKFVTTDKSCENGSVIT